VNGDFSTVKVGIKRIDGNVYNFRVSSLTGKEVV
jgi:hypothetical protein